MDVDDRLLMSYVDGELSPDERVATEAAVAASREVAERVAALRASCLPYRAAFEHVQQAPLPASLADRVDELVSVSRHPLERAGRKSPYLMFAALAAGIVLCAVTLSLVPSTWPISSTVEPWVKAVAGYQSLYARETIAALQEDSSATENALSKLRRTMDPKLNVPNLLPQGLLFKRLQQLDFRGQPLVQLVYLPQTGKPVALCMLKEAKPDEGVRVQTIDGMQAATWRRDHLAYVLLTPNSQIDVDSLAREIASGKVANVYADLPQG